VTGDGKAQVVATTQLSHTGALDLRNAARAAGGEGTRARVEPPEEGLPTRVTVWQPGTRGSELANRLIRVLLPELTLNMVTYTSTLSQPHQSGSWIMGVGIAFLTPQNAADMDRLVAHFQNGLEMLNLEVTVVFREDSFFVMSCRGALNYGLLQGQSSFGVVGEAIGINNALLATVQREDAPNDTVEDMVRRMREHLTTV
jgi:hypothetical protein